MHRALSVLLGIALLALPLAGCVGESLKTEEVVASGIPTQGDPTSPVDARLGQSVTTFGFALLKQMTAQEDGNVVISPLSAHASIAMAYNGAAGDTAEQMALALSLSDLSAAELNQGYGHLLASLAALPDESGVTLNVENSLWADEDFELYNDFVETDRSYFGAQLETLDLQNRGSKDRINGWIAERTNDKITDLIDEIPDAVVMYLINAMYMKGNWSVPFDPEQTANAAFAVGVDGSGKAQEVQVPFMSRGASDFNHAEVDGTQALRLPYGDGRMAMWVILPPQTDGDPRDAAYAEIDRLAAGRWDALTTQAETRPGQLVMPGFTSRTKTNLADALSAIGMPVAFDVDAADFSIMSPDGEDLYISRVLHETYIAVDEAGTEAAAATATEMSLGAALMTEEPFEMIVDRPFLFVIEDGITGAMLFLGVIEDPR